MKSDYLEEEGQKVLGRPDGSERNPQLQSVSQPHSCCDRVTAAISDLPGGCIASKPSVGQGSERWFVDL